MLSNNSIYGNYRQRKFTDIYPEYEYFKSDYDEMESLRGLKDDSVKTLFYMLYAFYGNSTIASSDENQFKFKLFTIAFMYGPAWERELEIQKALRELSLDDLREGSKTIFNHANNPSSTPAVDAFEPLNYINDQTANMFKKSKVDAYANLLALLKRDVTKEFLDKFKVLFLVIVQPELPLWYTTLIEEEEENAN